MNVMSKLRGKRKGLSKKGNPFKRRFNQLFPIAACLVLIGLFMLYKYDPLYPIKKETGKIFNAYNTQTRYGSGTRYVIELESGEMIDVNASRMGPFKKGRIVIVERMESRIFNKIVYRFIKYKE